MQNSFKLRNFWQKYNNYALLVILTAIITLITYYRVLIQFEMGPLSDSCDFLSNAMVFAGQPIGYSDLIRPPFFSFLLSIPFRMGYVSTNAIFVLDGLLFIFGVIGLYFLLKLRFNDIESFLGALLYATFPIVLVVIGVGFSDLSSVSITIWTFYFLILAVKKDSKFFYLVFPLAMLAFLTRYNSALIIFPLFLYIFTNKRKIKDIKNILIGMILSFLLLIPVFIFFYQKFGNVLYPFMNFYGTTSGPSLPEGAAYDANLFFFIDKFLLFIGIEGIITVFIILIGILAIAFLKLKRNSKNGKKILKEFKIEKSMTKLKLSLFMVLIVIFIASFSKISYMWSEVLFFGLGYLLYDLTKNLNIKNLDMDLLVFAWFMAFFIFHSLFLTKDNRYFVIMAPAVAYFLILGLSEVSKKLKFKIKNMNITFPLIALFLTLVIIFSTASFLPAINQSNEDNKVTNENIVLANEWLKNYDPTYKNKIIYSDLWPNFSWYLKTNVKMMPVFKDGNSYSGGVKEFNLTEQDNITYNKYLNDNNVNYYLCIRKGLNLTYYEPIKQFGNVIIYERK